MSPAMKNRPVAANVAAAPAPVGIGPGRYFDQTVFDLHFVLLSAHARRMADATDHPFSVDRDGRVTLRPADQGVTADESPTASGGFRAAAALRTESRGS
ncbi:MAG: hypothetical protein RLZZ563_2531 [Pseudomonadota bacterium]|jgi:hypothetical protein